jgi:hypothetical protein
VNEIRFELSVRQRLYLLFVGAVFLLIGTFMWVIGQSTYVVQLGVGTLMVVYFFLFARFGATIDATGVRLRGLTKQHVRWGDIRSIERYSVLGTTGVKLRLIDGRTKRLRAPVTGVLQDDAEFEVKLATLHQWWRHYTGQATAQPN